MLKELAVDVFAAVVETAEAEGIVAEYSKVIKEMKLSPKTEKRIVISKESFENLGDLINDEVKSLATMVANVAGDEAFKLDVDIDIHPEAEEIAKEYKIAIKLVGEEALVEPVIKDPAEVSREFERKIKGLVL